MSYKISAPKNFAIFTGKHFRQSLLSNVASLSLQLYLKRDSGTEVFLWILWKNLKKTFFNGVSSGCFWFQYVLKYISTGQNMLKAGNKGTVTKLIDV